MNGSGGNLWALFLENRMTAEFVAWPKIPRIKEMRVTVTEKMDGTNGCIIIEEGKLVGVQSRNRLISPGKDTDNMGFAHWVYSNEAALVSFLGEGYHFGEWVGPGIQKNPHNLEQKCFYLFNNPRWAQEIEYASDTLEGRLRVVPLLYEGRYHDRVIGNCMEVLKFTSELKHYKAEGIIVYWHDFRSNAKFTFENQDGKWQHF